ncbi:carbohydrate ABC transporter permease [Dictyobacter formicarum]|uniref:ABC transporter n=1 Tax=Dictyobacter formicarum TaxID=2778368 RepID=A0ABQ3VWI3_9CHLR|nr:sugar ABC transporter permease [Dictyobacter formicarum]GHO89933.1 ABC transporter [Dictyobacter formicarum]
MDTLTSQRSTGTARSVRPPATHRKRWSRYSNRTFYLFISPWVLGFLALTVIPLVYALVVSFTNFDGISTHWRFIGLANYAELLSTADTWYSLSRTLLYAVITVPLSVAGGLGLAILLNQRIKAVGLLRTIFYLPSIVPVVASAIMWKLILDRDAGALNAILEPFGFPVLTWLVDPYVFYALIILVLWGLGGGMVISLAGLQGVPSELREAARVDGANAWQAFRHVTLPLLSPVLFFQVVTGMIASLQTFVQPLLLSQNNGAASANAVPRSNYLYMVNVYQQFFYDNRFGFGSAMLWVLFLIVLAITLLVFRTSTFWVYYEVDRNE